MVRSSSSPFFLPYFVALSPSIVRYLYSSSPFFAVPCLHALTHAFKVFLSKTRTYLALSKTMSCRDKSGSIVPSYNLCKLPPRLHSWAPITALLDLAESAYRNKSMLKERKQVERILLFSLCCSTALYNFPGSTGEFANTCDSSSSIRCDSEQRDTVTDGLRIKSDLPSNHAGSLVDRKSMRQGSYGTTPK